MSSDLVALLQSALRGSPDNAKLLIGLLEAIAANIPEAERAPLERALSDARVESVAEQADQRTLARVLLRHQRAQQALELLSARSPENDVLRARCLLALERADEAARTYRTAVEANATLQDVELERLLAAPVARSAAGPQPLLRVLSNDDTSQAEVVRLFAPASDKITFADVGGLENVKQQTMHFGHSRTTPPTSAPWSCWCPSKHARACCSGSGGV